ncbi:MAG: hypothetical protein BJ554DRAFT_7005 [Olpidium bornovanus]|uniref:Uncharacterized protein n=1 Tax=Olpidium bornovanus TaxID=278681 RepID=A0A8H8DJS6_9FUNG|nr:MAG: hypothetical protein BJ554DRAFT_7005 [Olpidium bornovanus]
MSSGPAAGRARGGGGGAAAAGDAAALSRRPSQAPAVPGGGENPRAPPGSRGRAPAASGEQRRPKLFSAPGLAAAAAFPRATKARTIAAACDGWRLFKAYVVETRVIETGVGVVVGERAFNGRRQRVHGHRPVVPKRPARGAAFAASRAADRGQIHRPPGGKEPAARPKTSVQDARRRRGRRGGERKEGEGVGLPERGARRKAGKFEQISCAAVETEPRPPIPDYRKHRKVRAATLFLFHNGLRRVLRPERVVGGNATARQYQKRFSRSGYQKIRSTASARTALQESRGAPRAAQLVARRSLLFCGSRRQKERTWARSPGVPLREGSDSRTETAARYRNPPSI